MAINYKKKEILFVKLMIFSSISMKKINFICKDFQKKHYFVIYPHKLSLMSMVKNGPVFKKT